MKYFTKEVKIGITGIVAIAVMFLGINFLKGINLFKSSNSYYIEFKDAKGLAKSSPVYANGYNIGIVRDIIYDYSSSNGVIVQIDVDNRLRIPKGSSATLISEMLGGCTMNMIISDSNEYYTPGDTIKGNDTKGLMTKAEDMLPQVEQILCKVDTLLTTINTLAANPNLPKVMENAEKLTASLNESTKHLNRILSKDMPQITGKINKIGDNMVQLTDELNTIDLKGTMNTVDTTLNYVKLMTEKVNSKDNTVGLLLNDSTLYNNLTKTTESANNLLIDLKENPKRYVHFSLFGRKDK